MHRIATVILILLFAFCTFGIAQTTGKISGSVTDEAGGEPLPGANIIISGTTMGAAADMNGEFFIINIPPGTYTIEARMMGYAPLKVENVRVAVNRTTPLELNLKTSVIEGEEVVIKASKIVTKKDQTSSIRNISSEDIKLLPAESVGQIVNMQPGVVGRHFRGGRSNEVTHLIDGVAVTDAFSQEQKTSQVNPEVVEDIEVITGAFNAEYGDAMSGVVNVVTKDGRNNLDGSLSLNLGNYLTNNTDIFEWHDNATIDRLQDFKLAISGPIFKDKLFFVANARYNKNDGYLNGLRRFAVTDYSDYTSQEDIDWHIENTGDSTVVPMNWNEGTSAFGKLTWKPMNALKLSGSLTYNKGDGQGYNHAYRFNPDGVTGWHNETKLGMINLNHMLGKRAFYDLKFSYSDYSTGSYLYEDPTDPRYVHDQYLRGNGSYFITGGQQKGHTIRNEERLNLKFDFTWQATQHHSIKTGFDIKQTTLDNQYHNIRNGYEGSGLEAEFIEDSETGKRTYLFYEPIIHDNISVHTDEYEVKPQQGAMYIQDKMEFDMMVVNIGARFDYFNPNTTYPTNYRNPANQEYFDEAERISQYPDADVKTQVSPRLGLSYELGNSALLRFSYGHFLQLPPLNYYYQNSTFMIGTTDYATTMGNGQLQPQKTIQYEVGLFQQLTNTMSFEVAVWYKDIYDLVTATVYTTYNQRRYGVYTNKEYGNARGLEVKYDFRMDAFTAGLNYTFGYTKGVADNPQSSFNRAGSERDPVNKLIPMNWDQRHTANVYLGYNKTKWGATALCYLNSGQPYTWAPIPQSSLSAINLFPNNQYRPSKVSVDLRAYYNLAKFAGMDVQLTLLVYNLFDRLNESWVNSETGRAYTAVVQETDISGHRSSFSTYEDVYQNPSMYEAPRLIKVGLGVTF